MRTQHLFLLGALVVGGTACDPPTHPKRFAETIFNNACHFNFDCCTPAEREISSLRFLGGQALNEDECREELNDQFGGIFAVIVQAVDDGRATYDAEAADRCTKELQTAYDTCDSQKILGDAANSNSQAFLFDATDLECAALAQRGYTRGTVKDGDDCSNDVECADFGVCVAVEGRDRSEAIIDAGECRTPAGKGEDCTERDCGIGLACNGDVCVDAEEQDEDNNDGDACTSDFFCDSDNCSAVDGVCSGLGIQCVDNDDCRGFDVCTESLCSGTNTPCELDEDCGSVCEGAVVGVCEPAEALKIEICDGL